MYFKKFRFLCIVLFFSFFLACGAKQEDSNIILSGNVILSEETSSPSFIIISRAGDLDAIQKDPIDYVLEMRPTEYDRSFYIDLTETDLKAGDEIIVLGFVDNDFKDDFPYPGEGDYVGFYFNRETWATSIVLKNGITDGIDININRKVYDYDVEISGTLLGNDEGDVIIVAYAGNLISFDADDFDIDAVVGFKEIDKTSQPVSFTMPLIPYGFDLPIENVILMAFLDKNGNGKPDAGDKMGFNQAPGEDMPSLVTINEDGLINMDISFTFDLPEERHYSVPLTGTIQMPEGEYYDQDAGPLYVMIAKTDDPYAIMDNTFDSIKYFRMIEKPEIKTDMIDFNLDLSGTDLKAGDDIMVVALWDRDYVGGYPYPGPGDSIGFYLDASSMSPYYQLKEDTNDNISFALGRGVYDFNITASGTITDINPDAYDLYIVAYAGGASSLDPANLDFDAVIGYKIIEKPSGVVSLPYTVDIMPYFGKNVAYNEDPLSIDDVYLLSYLDMNKNGRPDAGDQVGFYMNTEQFSPVCLLEEGDNPGKDIVLDRTGHDLDSSIEGVISGNDEGDFIIIAYAGDLTSFDLANAIDFTSVVGFTEMSKGASPGAYELPVIPYFGENVSLNTSPLGMNNVFVMAILDNNHNGRPDPGDQIGFYVDPSVYAATGMKLPGVVTVNNGTVTDVNIEMFSTLTAPTDDVISLSGSFQAPVGYPYGDDLEEKPAYVLVGKMDGMDFGAIFNDPMNTIKMFQKLPLGATNFDIDLTNTDLTAGDNIFIAVIWDRNYQGGFLIPDEGDYAGFFQNTSAFSVTIPVSEGENILSDYAGYELDLNRKFYAHNSAISYELELGAMGTSDYQTGDDVIVVAVQADGINILSQEIDMNYVIGVDVVDIAFGTAFTMDILPAIYTGISIHDPFSIDDVYVFAMLDNNPENGMPDAGEWLGFYWRWVLVYLPATFALDDGVNTLDKTVRFAQSY